MSKETDLLELIESEALARCDMMEKNADAYVPRFNQTDWIGVIVVGIIFTIILFAGAV